MNVNSTNPNNTESQFGLQAKANWVIFLLLALTVPLVFLTSSYVLDKVDEENYIESTNHKLRVLLSRTLETKNREELPLLSSIQEVTRSADVVLFDFDCKLIATTDIKLNNQTRCEDILGDYSVAHIETHSRIKKIAYVPVVPRTLATQKYLRVILIISILFSLVVGLIARVLISKNIISPIRKIDSTLNLRTKNENELYQALQNLNLPYELSSLKNSLVKVIEKVTEAEKEKAFSAVAKAVAHDIRSPLSTLEVVVTLSEKLSDEEKKIALESIRRIYAIADDLLVKGKLSSKSHFQQQSAQEIVERLVNEKKFEFKQYPEIKFDFSFDEESTRSFIDMPANDLMRVLSNLINNSVEAFSEKSGMIKINLKTENGQVLISVNDNGPGIPLSILAKIRQGEAISTKEIGNGIGLVSSRFMVERNNGKFELISEGNKGTCIGINLPVNSM